MVFQVFFVKKIQEGWTFKKMDFLPTISSGNKLDYMITINGISLIYEVHTVDEVTSYHNAVTAQILQVTDQGVDSVKKDIVTNVERIIGGPKIPTNREETHSSAPIQVSGVIKVKTSN